MAENGRCTTSFGPIHVIQPTAPHTHTAILLHGRGSNGEDFAEELGESLTSDQCTIMHALPNWRWVFPSSKELWSPVFQEDMPAWFDAYSLTDVTARQDLQVDGIRESAEYIEDVVAAEVERLGGLASKVVLGGISLGGAVGIWAMFYGAGKVPDRRLGGFIGASTWLPFAADIENVLCEGTGSQKTMGEEFVASMMGLYGQAHLLGFPVLLGHGTDDAYVDVELGRQAKDVLSKVGLLVELKEYRGADQEGHWLKAPEEVDDMVDFLRLTESRA